MRTCDHLRTLRRRLHVPLAVLGHTTGIPISTLSLYERGLATLSSVAEHRLVQHLERIVTITALLPFPLDLSAGRWLKIALDAWPEDTTEPMTRERFFALAEKCQSKSWWGDESSEPDEFSPGPY